MIGVMDAVHARRHDDAHQPAFQANRQFDVGVMKEDRHEQHELPEPERACRYAEEQDLQRAIEDRERMLAKMEAQSGRAVEIAVDVMHDVEAPQKSDAMAEKVPDPERVVEQQNAEDQMQ